MTGSFRLCPDGIFRCDALQKFVWQEHGFGTREANPRVDITLRQIHSDRVINANGLRDRAEEGDALMTNATGTSIGVRTADCVPILLVDPANRAVAAVHAGWRGTASGIASRAVERMRQDFGTQPNELYAAMGPCIRDCCYEVGCEVAEKLSALFPEWGEQDRAQRCVDLPEANRRELESAGVSSENIFDSGLCTACQSARFFSYRREPENPGRMVAAIVRLA